VTDKFALSLKGGFGQHGRMNTADIPVFILCGGLGTRLKEETIIRFAKKF
jgi:hypothetical protein